MAEYISKLNMSVFVLDYDHNVCNPEEQKKAHKTFFGIIRENNPIFPVIIVSKPNPHNNDNDIEKNIIYPTYIDAYSKGDVNVYFIDCKTFFSSTYYDSYTVDDCHQNDLGHIGMANIIRNVIESTMNK